MRRLKLFAALALAGAAAGACAPHPIVARDPVPTPSPEEAYSCSSTPLPLNAYKSDCSPRGARTAHRPAIEGVRRRLRRAENAGLPHVNVSLSRSGV
ncbi:conserved exported protein of unknown function [Methylorubrum extorquens]|uniref:Lipoprotein n=1 Tax=Methylorubrum extorquens TaxID=408 RepID=A0A2N9APG2_METEX|nr:conserved exported protein of unknown function [Methylorubrum extorquens]